MNTDAEARGYVVDHLLRDAAAQEDGEAQAIGSGFQAFEEYAVRTHRPSWNDPLLGAAYTFWDAWIDARNHDWLHYPQMQKKDWPSLARSVVAAILAETDPMPLLRDRVI